MKREYNPPVGGAVVTVVIFGIFGFWKIIEFWKFWILVKQTNKKKTKQNNICIYVYMVVILGVILGEFRILNFGN